MDRKSKEQPMLIFFRQTPENLLENPPLASSLQHLETSFLMVALRRYPHALISCASAIESALKAAFQINPRGRNINGEKYDLQTLLNMALERVPANSNITSSALDCFRIKRNEIIHYGFSAKDDEISATLLLKTGYLFLEQCYMSFFDFPLKSVGKKYGGLLPEYSHHLGIAQNVYMKARNEAGLNFTYCFRAFSKLITWGLQDSMMSNWQRDVINTEYENCFELGANMQDKDKASIEREFIVSWAFDCPICNEPDTFICELDQDRLEKREISLMRGMCVHCSLIIGKKHPYLTDELCAAQINEVKPIIIHEYIGN
jgi:hypothetical protein